MNKQIILPTLASYKPQCQHSSANWLLYQAHLDELKLIDFNKDNSINLTYNISIGSDPLKAARVVKPHQDNLPFIGLALHSKYIVLKGSQLVSTFKLPLTCNITDFTDGFVGVEGVHDGIQTYFIFVTSKGQLFTVPVSHPENKVSFNVDAGANITGICVKDSYAYLGTQNGLVLRVDMNSRKIVQSYDTESKLPIYNIRTWNQNLLVSTCQGEIHILDINLKDSAAVSAHQGLVTMMCLSNDTLYSAGDDLVLRVWKISQEGTLTELRHQFYDQKPNLLFNLNGAVFLNFYEQNEAFAI